jgi:hypothetical protein
MIGLLLLQLSLKSRAYSGTLAFDGDVTRGRPESQS